MTIIIRVKLPAQVKPGKLYDLEITYTSAGGAIATLLVKPSLALTIATKEGGQSIDLPPSSVETTIPVQFQIGPQGTALTEAEIIVSVPESSNGDFVEII